MSQAEVAARSNISGGGANVAMAVAINGPMPGIAIRRRATALSRARRPIPASSVSICASSWVTAEGRFRPDLLARLNMWSFRLPALRDRPEDIEVIRTCRRSSSLSDAGRKLFSVSRAQRTSRNDADRLRKYLQRFELSWAELGG